MKTISNKMVIARKVLRSNGLSKTLIKIIRRLIPSKPAKTFPACNALVAGKCGLEIGGPSAMFAPKGLVPIYPLVAGLDNVNFANYTVWEQTIHEGLTFQFDPKKSAGQQYIAEATDLRMISSSRYEFVLSCHSIEHTANPIRALKEWIRVLVDGGGLLLVVPDKSGTFDHRRPVTTLQHLIDDFEHNTGEDDLTHLPEILELHDIDRDWGMPDFNSFKERALNNFKYRCQHHHVFDRVLVSDLLKYVGLKVLTVETLEPFHIIVTAVKG